MTVKVVTDSTCDIPAHLARDFDITVVPIYVVFGENAYRDRVDLGEEEFYERLVHDQLVPSTSVPAPNDFAEVYNRLAEEADEIISIHLTAKESGTYNSALLAKELVTKPCRIEVIDSSSVSMGFGITVLAASRKAREGASLDEVLELSRRYLSKSHLLIMVDTLKYVIRGGRLSKPHGILGSVLKVRPLLVMKEGHLSLSGVARTRAKALERLYEFARSFPKVVEFAVAYTTSHEDAQELADRLRAVFPKATCHITRVGPSLGTHAGPGAMGVAILES
jgi:DegV family protein with EDD domain